MRNILYNTSVDLITDFSSVNFGLSVNWSGDIAPFIAVGFLFWVVEVYIY